VPVNLPFRPVVPKIHRIPLENFKKWMVDIDGRSEKDSAYHYSREIVDISKHYLEKVGSPIDIYDVADIGTIRKLADIYNRQGKYRDFVRIRHFSSSISKYIQYAEFCLKNPGKYGEFHEMQPRPVLKIKNRKYRY